MRLDALLAQLSPEMTKVVFGDARVQATGIYDDSRAVQPGGVFVAYKGIETDGHKYLRGALDRGATCIVVEDAQAARALESHPTPHTTVLCANGREAFAWLCAAWHGFPSRSMKVIGVTGTDGKTTTSTLLFNVLRAAGYKAGLISTVSARIDNESIDTGLHTTTPDADDFQRLLARMREAGTTHAVLEVTSHGLAQHRVDGTSFDVAVMTNITRDHLDLHGTREAYANAKARLFELTAQNGGALVLNLDDAYSFARLRSIAARQCSYSRTHLADVSATHVKRVPEGQSIRIQHAQGEFAAFSPLIGDFNVSNVLAAASAALLLGILPSHIVDGVAATSGVAGRMERIVRGQPFTALVDFAHTPNALENALNALNAIKGTGRLIAVFGCAGERDREKRPLMAAIGARLADCALFTAEDPRRENLDEIFAQMRAGINALHLHKVEVIHDRAAALRRACALAQPGDIVVALGKGHEQSMCFGITERPWDDREELGKAVGV